MTSDNKNRFSGNGISIGQMKKELQKHGIIPDKDTDIAQVYDQLIREKGVQQSDNQPLRYSGVSENKKYEKKLGSLNDMYYNEEGQRNNNPEGPNLFHDIMKAVLTKSQEKSNQNQFTFDNSDVTQSQSINMPKNELYHQNQILQDQVDLSQNQFRQSRIQAFTNGQQAPGIKLSIQNQGNRASSSSANSNRQSGGIFGAGAISQRSSQDDHNFYRNVQNSNNLNRNSLDSNNANRISFEYQSPNNQIWNNNNNVSPQSYGHRSHSNSHAGLGFIPNDNSSKRVSNQSFATNNFNNFNNLNRRQSGSISQNQIGQNNNQFRSGGNDRYIQGMGTPIGNQQIGDQNINQKQQFSEGYFPSSNIHRRTDQQYTDKKTYGKSLLETARALSQSQKKQNNFTSQNESLLNITQFIFGDNKSGMNGGMSAKKSGNINLEDDQIYSNAQQHQKLNIKDRYKILLSSIETNHVIMFLMIALFSIFFLQNIYAHLTYKPELKICDSTMKKEYIDTIQCIPCPENAQCLNGNIECQSGYILVDRKCIINPSLQPNAIRYLLTVVDTLQYLQAQYYCYDPNSSGYGNNFSRPYKEHKREFLDSILLAHHGKEDLYFETLKTFQDTIISRGIRDQFDLNYDTSREVYFVTTFNPSYYCRLRLYLYQNQLLFGVIAILLFIAFLLYQLTAVRNFLYSFKIYKQQNANEERYKNRNENQYININNKEQLGQNQSHSSPQQQQSSQLDYQQQQESQQFSQEKYLIQGVNQASFPQRRH